MDIQQFISSGVIEAYVLGIASKDEVRELKELEAKHPEVADAIKDVQHSMEKYTSLHATPPPAETKSRIWSAIEQSESGASSSASSEASAVGEVRSFGLRPEETFVVRRSYFPLAAAVALLISSVVLNFIFWGKSERMAEELALVESKQEKILVANEVYKQQLQETMQTMDMVMDPAMKPVMLAGVGTHTENKAMVFWDTRSKEVYLALKHMPPPPAGKQYQLWAMVNGKPVDAGVFALNKKAGIQKMHVIPQAEMFAITLEKEGGSPTPTMTELYVAGKV